MNVSQAPSCVTHGKPVVDCAWRFDWGLMAPADRAQCSDVNGPGWIPPTSPIALAARCPDCGRHRPILEQRGNIVRVGLCSCTVVSIEIVKVKETTP